MSIDTRKSCALLTDMLERIMQNIEIDIIRDHRELLIEKRFQMAQIFDDG